MRLTLYKYEVNFVPYSLQDSSFLPIFFVFLTGVFTMFKGYPTFISPLQPKNRTSDLTTIALLIQLKSHIIYCACVRVLFLSDSSLQTTYYRCSLPCFCGFYELQGLLYAIP